MKKIVLTLTLLLSSFSFSEIKYKIVEPITFKNINTTSLDRNKVYGKGIIEIYTDDEAEDLGKFIKLDFPDTGLMTNNKKWIPLEKIVMEKNDREFILIHQRKQIKIYGILDRKKLDRGEDASVIEGDYKGIIPLMISEYSRIN